MQGGEDVVEQVFHVEAEAVEIALRRCREIGAPGLLSSVPQAIVAKPCGEEVGATLDQVQLADMWHETSLRFFSPFSQMLRGRQPKIPLEHMRPIVWTWTSQQPVVGFPIKPSVVKRAVSTTKVRSFLGSASGKPFVAHGAGI